MKFIFENSIGYHINKVASLMRIGLSRGIQKEYPEITVDYWVVLNRLWQKDGMIQSELAKLSAKDNASMTRMLDGMQKKGLVERKPDENDRRAFRIYLTPKSRKLEAPLKLIAAENQEKALKNLNKEETETLKKLLKMIGDNY